MSAAVTGPADLIDHHCHGLVLDPLDRPAFEGLLNEAAGPPALGTSFFDSMLGLAVRRWCAPVLGLEPAVDADAYLTRRAELGAEASRRLVRAAGVATFLVDTGLRDPRLCSPARLAELADATAYEVIRLEALAEALLDRGTRPIELADRVEEALRSTSAVAAKSVAAYRSGLDLPNRAPDSRQLAAALGRVRPVAGRHRVVDRTISGWLAWAALRARLPLQIHVGLGDADLDLRAADPLRLTPFLRATEALDVPVLLLHCYPFHRAAAYLAQVYGHVFLDVGLAVHNTGALSRTVIRETLELVPFGKLLFATDAYGLAELYHLGALLFRRGLAAVLTALVDTDELTEADAARIDGLIGRDNALRVYRL